MLLIIDIISLNVVFSLHFVAPFKGTLKIAPSQAAKLSSELLHEDLTSSLDLSCLFWPLFFWLNFSELLTLSHLIFAFALYQTLLVAFYV